MADILTALKQCPFAPGARVLIRDAEWLIRRVEPTATGHWALTVIGVSELVRNREAVFISNADYRDGGKLYI